MLVRSGFPLDIPRKDELTALCIACKKPERFSTVQLLLKGGANINYTTKDGISPLYIALTHNNM